MPQPNAAAAEYPHEPTTHRGLVCRVVGSDGKDLDITPVELTDDDIVWPLTGTGAPWPRDEDRRGWSMVEVTPPKRRRRKAA